MFSDLAAPSLALCGALPDVAEAFFLWIFFVWDWPLWLSSIPLFYVLILSLRSDLSLASPDEHGIFLTPQSHLRTTSFSFRESVGGRPLHSPAIVAPSLWDTLPPRCLAGISGFYADNTCCWQVIRPVFFF